MPEKGPSQKNSTSLKSEVQEKKEKIEKEYERKLYVLTHKQRIAKYIRIGSWAILGLLLVIALTIIALKIVDIFSKEEEPVVVEEVDAPPEGFNIETEKVEVIQPIPGETSYDVLVKIKNVYDEWGVSRLKYKIVLKDKFDKVVGEKERVSYILPKQEKHLIEIGLETERVVAKSEVVLEMEEIQKLKDNIDLDIQVEKSSYGISDNKGRVDGTLFNYSPFSFDRVDINVILYNKQNQVIGLNYTNIGSFITNTRRAFIAQWISNPPADVDRIVIEPRVNVFQSGSFMNIYGTGQKLEY